LFSLKPDFLMVAVRQPHWIQAASFKARFPDVRMEEDRIYINDGPIGRRLE